MIAKIALFAEINQEKRLTGEKPTSFIEFLYIHGSLHKRMKTQRDDQSRKLLHLLDKFGKN